MVRLLLVLAPAVCCLAAIGVSHLIGKSAKSLRLGIIGKKEDPTFRPQTKSRMPWESGVIVISLVILILKLFIVHSTELSSWAYSSPSFIMASGNVADGDRQIYDDYRETYYWMKQNTPKDSKILAWWDYGYQITGMSNRTVIVDNNTWNNTHIATVAKVLISDEETAYQYA